MSTLISDERETETVLSVRLDNAKRDTLCSLDLLLRAVQTAEAAGREQLAKDIWAIYEAQQNLAARLIQVAGGKSGAVSGGGVVSKHTPGPWRITEQGKAYQMSGRGWEDFAKVYKHPEALEESKANSLLIAAAPDLLAACKAVIATAAVNDHSRAMQAAINAIAKAEGKQS